MKQIISIVLSFAICLSFITVQTEIFDNIVCAADTYFQGSGTKDDPYQIASKSDLENLAKMINNPEMNPTYTNSYYIQTKDIDLQNESWIPIGIHWDDNYNNGNRTFDGCYNGLGHTIKGLNVDGEYNFAGLFGSGNPTISNLHVEGNVSPKKGSQTINFVGGLIAEIGGSGQITNCSFKGNTSAATINSNSGYSACGGLVCNVYEPTDVRIINSYFNGTITNAGAHSTAGIVGKAKLSDSTNKLTIMNCYSTGTANIDDVSKEGAIIGDITSNGTIELRNCFYTYDMGNYISSNYDVVTIINSMSVSDEELQSEGIINLGLGSAFEVDKNNINSGFPVNIYQNYSLLGYGTKDNPYQISSKEDLFYMSDAVNSEMGYDSYYIQTADIDLENENLIPIGTYTTYNTITGRVNYGFRGHYNGNYHEIDNMYISRSGEKVNYSGLFGWVYHNASISNLTVRGCVEIETGAWVGGIIGEIGYDSSITNCAFMGSVKSLYATGGIIGGTWQGATINNCYFNGTVESLANDSELNNAESLNACGGITGRISIANESNEVTTIENCYAVGEIKKNSDKIKSGAISGYIKNATSEQLNINNNYYLNTIEKGAIDSSSYIGCTPFNSNAMKACSDMLGEPFVDNTNENFNNGYPVFVWQIEIETFEGLGTAQNPYKINNADDLRKLATYLNSEYYANDFRFAYYKQTANINLNNERWTPMGGFYGQLAFEGVYDGSGHSIKGLKIDDNQNYVGLFRIISNEGMIKRLVVYGEVKSTKSYVGGIVGEIGLGGTVSECSFIGNVNADSYVGGISGKIYDSGNVFNSYHIGEVSGNKDVGGISGVVQTTNGNGTAMMKNCYHVGKVTANIENAGGIVGFASYDEATGNVISLKNCYYLKSSANIGINGNSVVDDCMSLPENLLKKVADDLGTIYVSNPNPYLVQGYPCFKWQVKGDVNADGNINVTDAFMLQEWLLDIDTLIDLEQADLYEDEIINILDICILKEIIIG